MTESTAMMRRKNPSRRVRALSSDSIRSDEIAATDMALSREASREGVSDMRIDTHISGGYPYLGSHDPPAGQNQLGLRQAAVTQTTQDVRIGTTGPPFQEKPSHGDQIWASDRNARRAAA